LSRIITLLVLMLSPVALAGDLRIEAWKQDVRDNRVKASAEIIIDGELTGLSTPEVVRGLGIGTHRIELRSGCALAEGTVTFLAEDENAHFELDLVAQLATLRISVLPPDALLQLDGRPLDVDEEGAKVECGPHTLSASLAGHSTALTNLDIAAGEIYPVEIRLEALGEGKLSVRVEPESAHVLLNGEDIGRGDQDIEVYQGPHVVEARLKGHVSRKDTFFIMAEESYTVDLVLQPDPVSVRVTDSAPYMRPTVTRSKALGLSLSAVGAGILVYGGVQLLQTMSLYSEYKQRVDTVNAGFEEPSHASEFYDAEVAQRAPRMRASIGLGSAALAGGLIVSIRF
jgi:hypothetical protein